MSNQDYRHPSSYRDPSGFVFEKEGVLYRQVNPSYREHFDHFLQSGCYEKLSAAGMLVRHEEIAGDSNEAYRVIRPQQISFISYPYEWSFDMLKDAALLTLQVMKEALQFGMILKDATPYNIQFQGGKPIFIDTLSFEKYAEKPWIAYRQFCESFLGPLLVMHYQKRELPGIQLAWPNGIPLSVISSLLPFKSRFALHCYLHIHLHAKYSLRKNNSNNQVRHFSRKKLQNLIASLEILVNKLRTPLQPSTWSGYYDEAAQRTDYLEQKKKIITQWITSLRDITLAADFGANTGEFSNLLATKNIPVVATDFDPYCINDLYRENRGKGEKNILPLVLDLSNPSPSIGVNNQERRSFIGRTRFDLMLALALIHHLVIGKNIPFDMTAEMFAAMGDMLIIEFVPKTDEKIVLMLSQKEDIYSHYDQPSFEKSFELYFEIKDRQPIAGSGRTLYRMQRKRR